MARGRDKHDAHKAAVAALGKNLSRRARSQCELCEDRAPLKVVEVDGNPDEPNEDWAVMICEPCEDALGGKARDTSRLRVLEGTMWSEVRPVQITAVRILRTLDESWARDALEGLYLDPEVEALIEA